MTLTDNDPDGEKYPGFKSGVTKDGSILYVGTGVSEECDGDSPARISSNNDDKGAYCQCFSIKEYFDNKDAKYFLDHPKLKWVPTNATGYKKIEGTLWAWQNSIGRVTLSSGLGKIFHQIGAIRDNQICYWQNEVVCEVGSFDILACER